MLRHAFRHLGGLRGIQLLLSAIVTCACTALIVRADERPSKSVGAGVAKASAAQQASTDKPSKQHIQQLIQDLGSSQYTARRAASTELRQIGSDAFDLLDAATDNADPEVAASATYLLRQIPVRWVQADDHAYVRAVMRNYGQESETRRLRRVEDLDRLSSGKGIPVLCRIVRYDRSSLVSRKAALVIIRPEEKSSEQTHIDSEVVERELGASTRASAQWLRQYLAQLRD